MEQTYYIFRHAVATKSTMGYGDKIYTASILPEGIEVIKKIALYLQNIPTDYHSTSAYPRCRQTAQIVENITGKGFQIDSRLNEYYEETFENFKKRVENFLRYIQLTDYKTIVICTHAAVIAGLKNFLLTDFFDESKALDYPNSGVLYKIQSKKIEIMNFNDKGNLT